MNRSTPESASRCGLGLGEDAERGAQLDVQLGLDALGGRADRVEVALRRAARRGHHAVALRARGVGPASTVDELVDRLHRRLAARRRVLARLRAEPAVLRTGAELGVVEHVQRDAAAPVGAADAEGSIEETQHVVRGCMQHRSCCVARQNCAGEGLISEGGPIHGGDPRDPSPDSCVQDWMRPRTIAAITVLAACGAPHPTKPTEATTPRRPRRPRRAHLRMPTSRSTTMRRRARL